MSANSFHTTHWTAVLAAKEGDTQGRAALRELCVRYREPIRRFIARCIRSDDSRRYGARDAEDLTQDFLAELLEGHKFTALQRREGKFRTYLLGAVKHFLSERRKREQAARRGGEVRHVPIPEDLLRCDFPEDAVFDRDWACSMIDRAVQRLGDAPQTQALLPFLSRELGAEERIELCTSLNMNETALKVALHRLRKRFRRIVRDSIAQTVVSQSQVEEELLYLIAALSLGDR